MPHSSTCVTHHQRSAPPCGYHAKRPAPRQLQCRRAGLTCVSEKLTQFRRFITGTVAPHAAAHPNDKWVRHIVAQLNSIESTLDLWGFMARWAAAGIVNQIRDHLTSRIRRELGKGQSRRHGHRLPVSEGR